MSRYSIASRAGALLALLLLAVVPGCSRKDKNVLAPAVQTPSSATINGYQTTPTPGMVNFDVSAVTQNGALLTSGAITEPAFTGLAIGTSPRRLARMRLSAVVTGIAAVCGPISSRGTVVAAICLDATGSMSSSDPDTLRSRAAKAFIARMSSGDVAEVSSFDTGTPASPGLLAIHTYGGGFGSDHARLFASVDSASFAGGSTPLWDAAYDCAHVDSAQGGANLLALLLTDGGDGSSAKTVVQAENYARQKNVRVYMVGLDVNGAFDDSTEAHMKWLAQETGGFYARADSAGQMSNLFGHVFNASHASGCVSGTFLVDGVVPLPGTIIVGTMSFKVNGTAVTGPFRVVL